MAAPPSRLRGHDITCVNGEWHYKDTMTPTVGNKRDCGHCGRGNTPEGHDGCLGELPDVMSACCGHGEMQMAYVQYWNDRCVRGLEALTWLRANTQETQ